MKLLRICFMTALLWFGTAAYAGGFYGECHKMWLDKAQNAVPELAYDTVRPVAVVRAVADESAFQGTRLEPCASADSLYILSAKNRKDLILDFGRHMTGHLSFAIRDLWDAQDAPVRFRLVFAEVPGELAMADDEFTGTLSRGWMQDIEVDVMPHDTLVTIPRRMAARYVRIEPVGTSQYHDFTFDSIYFVASSSAGACDPGRLANKDPEYMRIAEISARTLAECMQTVYEDGPKRDRRLWLGDMYLEALANSVTFRKFDLTRRCLYLFAALSNPDNGLVLSNCFELPRPHAQMTLLVDYSLLFNLALADYLNDTSDRETALDLWPVARRQIDALLAHAMDADLYDSSARIPGSAFQTVFMDWEPSLDKNAAMQMLLIHAIARTTELGRRLGREADTADWVEVEARLRRAAMDAYYDRARGVVVSGPEGQVSLISQAWAAISGVLDRDIARKAMLSALSDSGCVRPATPYCWHFVIEGMIACGLRDRARAAMDGVWGEMARMGADTFYEAFDSGNHMFSPYGFAPLNSYCHAWSCTPVYFFAKYPEIF